MIDEDFYMKRIMTIQDISCIGKCSLTVALPIISAIGIETAIVPTAVLSTHTHFKGFTFRDLTDDLDPIKDHWKKEGFSFDAIYTGYLGSLRQVDLVLDYFRTFRTASTITVVDPVMADNGKLYAGFDESFARKMLSLCSEADIILPNLSEASLLLGEPYPGEDASWETSRSLLKKLAGLGCKVAVITGVTLKDGSFGCMAYDNQTGTFSEYGNEKIPFKCHGTGDIFASTFTGALVKGKNIQDALRIAADYTGACIRNSCNDPDRVDYGVNFESEIPYLLKLIAGQET